VGPAFEQEIREAYAAFAAGDVDGVMATFFTSDASYVNPDYALEPTVHGHEAFRRALLALHEQFEYQSVEVEEIEDGPNGLFVLVRLKATGKTSGAPLDETFAHVFRMSGRVASSYEWYTSREEGRAAAGLA